MNKQNFKFGIVGIILAILTIIPAKGIDTVKIPLTYAFDWDLINKLPIEISFNHSNVYSTTDQLYLLKFNLTVDIQSFPSHQNRDRIEIGLKYPSDFISAMAATFKISYDSV